MAMSETVLSEQAAMACKVAAGGPADPGATGRKLAAAHKDLNAKGRGPWWYRMVWRGGSWQYFSEERLPAGTFRAAERRATVYGEVYPGELVCSHDKGGPLDDEVYLETGTELVECKVTKRRDGQLAVTLPDGVEVLRPNPRKR
jgi:hypothetical protein